MKQISKIVTFYTDGTFTESLPKVVSCTVCNDNGYVCRASKCPSKTSVTKPFYNQCSVCNMYMSGMKGYVCGNNNCPSQVRVTS